jgi:hypothetical protein
MSQLSYTNFIDGDQPLAAGFNSRFLLAINLLNSGIESDNIASSAVTTAKIANDAVTLAKMEDGTQGDTLYYGASGAPARLGAGTSGQFLQTLGAGANPAWADVPQSVGNAWLNLVVTRPGTTQVTVTADQLVVRTTGGSGVRITSVNVTGTITTSGANGLDTGAEAANTIYYVWVIRKSSDGTVAALFSTASAIGSITFPSGYDQAALVSAVGNNNSSDFIDFRQTGKNYTFKTWATLASANPGGGSWVSIDLTPSNMSTVAGFVPSGLSNKCFGALSNPSGGNGSSHMTNDSSVATGTTIAPNKIGASSAGTVTAYWDFDVLTSDTLYYLNDGAGTTNVYLGGFEINKLA